MAQFRSFNSDIPDPSIEVKVSAAMPNATVRGATGNPIAMPVKVDSRINVEIKITNATMRNLDSLLANIRNEVTTRATQLIDIPETEDVPGFS